MWAPQGCVEILAILTFSWPFLNQTAIKRNNPRKFLRSVGDGETVEFDVVKERRFGAVVGEPAKLSGEGAPGGSPKAVPG